MQEEMTVQFQPIYEGHTSWFQRLFIIYLLSVLLITVFRSVRLIWRVRKLRRQKSSASSGSSSEFLPRWDSCQRDTESMKKFSHLTLLLSLLVLAMGSINVLAGVSTAKAPSVPYTAGYMADAITPFSVGIGVCIVLYCCAMFFDALLARRKSK
jgi:hypothetical protein